MNDKNESELKVYSERPNKTVLKKEHLKIQQFAENCVNSSKKFVEHFNFSETVLTQLALAKKLKGRAYKRQIKHLTNLIEDRGEEFIEKALNADPEQFATRQFKKFELLAEQLIEGEDKDLNKLISENHQIERQSLRQLILKTRRDMKEHGELDLKPIVQYLKQHIN